MFTKKFIKDHISINYDTCNGDIWFKLGGRNYAVNLDGPVDVIYRQYMDAIKFLTNHKVKTIGEIDVNLERYNKLIKIKDDLADDIVAVARSMVKK